MNNDKTPDKWLTISLIAIGFVVAISAGWWLGMTPEEFAANARAAKARNSAAASAVKADAACNKCLLDLTVLTYAFCKKNAEWNGETGSNCWEEGHKAARIAVARRASSS